MADLIYVKDDSLTCEHCPFFDGQDEPQLRDFLMSGKCLLLDERIGVSPHEADHTLTNKHAEGLRYYVKGTIWDECPKERRDEIIKRMAQR